MKMGLEIVFGHGRLCWINKPRATLQSLPFEPIAPSVAWDGSDILDWLLAKFGSLSVARGPKSARM
jgi:hypothetical protein